MKKFSSGSIDSSIIDMIKESIEMLANEAATSIVLFNLKSPQDGFDYHWFFDAASKQLERFNKGIQVEVIEEYDDDSYLCAYRDKLIIVKKDTIGCEVEH